ncbi:amino acid adenylation domain-containing protein [Myxococcus sp. CA033]|uniref:non-ribosomal peptide synthetase n=1 Tax=Myxococcus sp. CA033 TaxID=2741516 RepID=UPI00157BAABC|nr:non-ribosomal peptide synthetase [Myxococcus sp. CA033]NTX38695.1 amino acid adenylation domain-containing protein [Myxococcus sp. CA033]
MPSQNDSVRRPLEDRRATLTRWLRERGADPANLTPTQRRLWMLLQLDGTLPAQVLTARELRGALELAPLQQAIAEVGRRHDLLRSTFKDVGGTPLRLVHPIAALSLRVTDVTDADAAERLSDIAREMLARRADVASAPLVDLRLVRLAADSHVLFATGHELVVATSSLESFVQELLTTYAALHRGEPLGEGAVPSHAEHATREHAWLASPEGAAAVEHWRRRLADVPVLQLPTDRPRPAVKTHRSASVHQRLPRELLGQLSALATRTDEELGTVLLTGLQTLLARYSLQVDVTVGVRDEPPGSAESEPPGPGRGPLVLRVGLGGDPSFEDALRRTGRALREARKFGRVPFATLVEALQPPRDLSRTPFFQTLFQFRDAREALDLVPGLRVTPHVPRVGTTPVDLTLAATATQEGLHLRVDYNTDLFDASTARRMLDHLRTLLDGALTTPTSTLSALRLLPAEEWGQVLHGWNETAHAAPSEKCLHELVEAQAARTPGAWAVTGPGGERTYAMLDEQANQLAHHLRGLGLEREDRVALCLERSVEMVVAMLAVLKAGGAYVPLDPEYPTERLTHLLTDSGARVLITQRSLTARLGTSPAKRLLVDEDWPAIAANPRSAPPRTTTPAHLAYLIYTSGSTGTPKAVMLTHRGIVNNLTWRQATWPLNPEDRVLQNHSFSFDPSVWATFWPLLVGARTVVTAAGQATDSRSLVELMRSQGITVYGAVPSLNSVLMEEPDIGRCTRLRYVLSGAEALTGSLQRSIFSRVSATVANLYGPTETTIDATSWTCPRVDEPEAAPIGRPIGNTRTYVVDAHLQPVPVGVPGEICIGGAGLARGYHGRPGLTAERFVPDPFSSETGARLYRTGDLGRYRADGAIMFLGRVDDQVKVSGYRVELGEVEAALGQHPDVREVVVVAHASGPDMKRLVAYIVPAENAAPQARALSTYLEGHLPTYMVPTLFVIVSELPRTANGKVNRQALPAPQVERAEPLADSAMPRSPLEEEIAAAFGNVLGTTSVGIHDDFFGVGGTSLMLAKLASRLLNRFEIAIPVHQFFKVPTVAGVANVVETFQREGLEAVLMNQHATRLDTDATLPPDISPEGLPEADFLDPSAVLLTGATGYLGAFLLEQLLKCTRATVYCLVRADTPAQAMKRVRTTMEQYLVWDEAHAARIRPLVGDLAKPRLGLDEAEWDAMAGKLDAIYHNGALVNFVYPYSALRGPNVQGTQEVLRLACLRRLKAVHYVSTIDVLLATHMPRPFLEDDSPLHSPVEVPGGYTGSKWVAEKVVDIARQRGIPVGIYRPGLILSHEETGATQTNDYLLVAFRGYVPMGILPEYPRIFDTIPVDYAAKAIVHISLKREAFGRFFHLFNPAPVSLHQFCEWIRSYGYEFDIVPFDEARRRALEVDTSHPLYPLVPLIRDAEAEPTPALDPSVIGELQPEMECANALEVLAGSGIRCPPMTEALAHRCIQYLVDVGFLPPPEALRTARSRQVAGT